MPIPDRFLIFSRLLISLYTLFLTLLPCDFFFFVCGGMISYRHRIGYLLSLRVSVDLISTVCTSATIHVVWS